MIGPGRIDRELLAWDRIGQRLSHSFVLTVSRPSETVPTNLEMVMGQAMTSVEEMCDRQESYQEGRAICWLLN
jgi:hypothetical protein